MSPDDPNDLPADAKAVAAAVARRLAGKVSPQNDRAGEPRPEAEENHEAASGIALVAGEAAAGLFRIEQRVRATGGRGGSD